MNDNIKHLLFELEEQLKFIDLEQDDPIKSAQLCIDVCLKAISKLKYILLKHKFKNQSEEIKFFKETKPKFLAPLIYHLKIYKIESRKPNGSNDIRRKYLLHELDKLKHYFDSNLDFYRYYRTQSNYLDHKYFIRGKYDIRLTVDSFFFEADERVSTSHDFKVAKILAHDRLQVYLEEELSNLDRKESGMITQEAPKVKLYWTESKTALIELIYALHSQGAFDNGRADIKDIAASFEHLFGVELGDYYRTFLELRMRKTGRTKFLHSLISSLTKKMDEAEEK
ncbi:MAG: RteC domain-containing protein [Chitinophagaceae bacterium]|nr:RteC domain-containing protein [Chitinophagaceae bacterium]